VVYPNTAGPLPVFLELHSAVGNGPMEPPEFIDTLTPGIYISPVDISYQHGLLDPLTGAGRWFSQWMGYKDANGVYQPVTADRVIRYVRWVLTQTAKWTADVNRVYVRGWSMGGGGAMRIAAFAPDLFAAGISSLGWVDLASWSTLGDCQPGVRWKAANGPLCTDMLDMIYLVQHPVGVKVPLYLTWNSNDSIISPAKYPSFITALENAQQAYQAEWRLGDHTGFALPGDPHFNARLNAPPAVGAVTGSSLSSATGTRQDITSTSATPPSSGSPAPTPTGCTTPDPFVSLGGGTCVDGNWLPPATSPTPTPTPTPPPPSPPATGTITVNPSVQYQKMVGWEGLIAGSVEDFTSLTAAQLGAMLDLAVTDYGVTRIRVPIRSGWEGPGLRYDIVNDNADPNVLNEAGFNWTNLDIELEKLVIPARQRVIARGETPYILLSYVDFGTSAFEHYANPPEYAEFIYAVYKHMQTKYGFVPNGLDVIVEPDNIAPNWNGTQIGQVIVATANKLAAQGFPVPEFVVPSVTNVGSGVPFVNEINAVPGAMARVSEISYHRYGGIDQIPNLVSKALSLGKRTSMTEFVVDANNYDILHQDLTTGRNSAWAQGIFGDAYGCAYGQISYFANGTATFCPNSKLIRQYTKYVRPGAQRIEATSQNASFKPVAFVNENGKYVVVIKSESSGSFSVSGLPAGTYGVFYSTDTAYNVNLSNVTITTGQALTTSMPGVGVITIYKN
jgi:dienelactone hydrolase